MVAIFLAEILDNWMKYIQRETYCKFPVSIKYEKNQYVVEFGETGKFTMEQDDVIKLAYLLSGLMMSFHNFGKNPKSTFHIGEDATLYINKELIQKNPDKYHELFRLIVSNIAEEATCK